MVDLALKYEIENGIIPVKEMSTHQQVSLKY